MSGNFIIFQNKGKLSFFLNNSMSFVLYLNENLEVNVLVNFEKSIVFMHVVKTIFVNLKY